MQRTMDDVHRLAGRALPRRLTRLLAGLVLYGVSMTMLVRADLGVMPWDVLHQGLARRLGHSMGLWTIVVGVVVLLLWVPLRQRPGVGTVLNVLVVGVVLDACLGLTGPVHAMAGRVSLTAGGIVLNAVATALYVGAGLGPGPRDGLMTGVVARTGWSVRVVRTTIEVVVVAVGWVLGGTVGVGTVAYAVAVGPLVHLLLPVLSARHRRPAEPAAVPA
ncbi:membrane protein [Angustibacter aerolatus]|uniref:Membrane protein n=1 Tax=Angustibacter aerolatus TaxID=1162965 RepID=A0ABQ6JEY6_9ACTN|nr:membrane protein [Angustibacter aerolatus]